MGEEPETSGLHDGGLTGSGGAHEFRSARSPSGAFPPETAGTADATIRVDSPRAASPSGSVFEPKSVFEPSPSGSVFEPRTPKVSSSGGSSIWGDDPLGLSKPTQVRSTSEARPSSTSQTRPRSSPASSSVWGDDPLGLSKPAVAKPAAEPAAKEEQPGSNGLATAFEADPLSPSGSVFKLSPSPASADDTFAEPASLNLDNAGDFDSTSPFAKPDLTANDSAAPLTEEPPTVIDAPAIVPDLAGESAFGAAEAAALATELSYSNGSAHGAEQAYGAGQAYGVEPGQVNGGGDLWSASSLGVSAAPPSPPVSTGPASWNGGPVAGGPAQPKRRGLAPIIGIAAALIVLIGGSVYYFGFAHKASPSAGASGGTKSTKTAPKSPTIAKGPEHLVSTTPANGDTDVNGGDDIRVVFSEPLAANSPMPTLHPAVKGSWHVDGDAAVFVPATGIWQRTKVKVSIPTGTSGIRSNGGGVLSSVTTAAYSSKGSAAATSFSFTTGKFSEERLIQLLAQLDYLPLTWAPSSGRPVPLSDAAAQYSAAYDPPQGDFNWESGYPARLQSLWNPDGPSEILRGAVAAFQADHGLIEDMIAENQDGLITSGSIGHRLWVDIFKALAKDQTNKHGYTYAVASQHAPETLTVWHNGKEIFHHLANTGIPVSPTSPGTNPVYIRYQSQIMRGTNPDGSKYADPVAWVAYFHEGEAVHYFPRYSYGSQQSLGCVELPYNEAKAIWPFLTYGTLVTVTPV
jgi:L,D-transpeptidase catalytic domain/Bacterial Ig-like domain